MNAAVVDSRQLQRRQLRPGALRQCESDLPAECRPFECAQPGLLTEDLLGAGHGQYVVLNFLNTLIEFGECASLSQHGGCDRPGRCGRDDVRNYPLRAHQILQCADLE